MYALSELILVWFSSKKFAVFAKKFCTNIRVGYNLFAVLSMTVRL